MELDWNKLLRAAGNDPDDLRAVWTLALVYAPDDDGLRRRIEAQGRTAEKRRKRLAAEAGDDIQSDAAQAPPTAPAPAARPATSAAPVGEEPVASGGYRPEEEEHDFVRDVTKAVFARLQGLELSREDALAALAVWREQVTVDGQPLHYVRSPGWTGATLLTWLCARYSQLTPPAQLAEDSVVWEITQAGSTVMRVLGWTLPDRCPAEGDTFVEYDVTAQYLAAMRSTLLGDGEPIILDSDALAAWSQVDLVKRPGWIELATAPDLTGLPDHVQAAFARLDAGSILPTPLAGYLVRDHGLALDVDRAVIWDRKSKGEKDVRAYGPRLSRVAEELAASRDRLLALVAADPAHPARYTLALLKDVYARYASGFLRSDKHNETPRPDWADMIAGTASANSLRAQDKAVAGGWSPAGQSADSVWFVLDVDPAQVPEVKPAGLEISNQPGKWHLNRWGAATQRLVRLFQRGHHTAVGGELGKINQARIDSEGEERQ